MADRYEIQGKLGAGGFGLVYQARDTMLGRNVAIKRLITTEDTEAGDAADTHFSREATTLAALAHPNVVNIFDFDRDDEGWFVVMELLEGEDLKDRLDHAALSWEETARLIRQSLDGIHAAHEIGVLHRDLKPENIFLHQGVNSGDWVVKMIDFGLAKKSSAPSRQTMDQKGNIFGSLRFMAPEQILRKPLDRRTDLYALGCVYYRVLGGAHPFEGDTGPLLMESHIKHIVKPLSLLNAAVHPALEAWVMRLIAPRPEARPPSAAAALREFEAALLGEMPPPPPPIESAITAPVPAPRPQRPVPGKPGAPAPQAVVSASGARQVSPAATPAKASQTKDAPAPTTLPSAGRKLSPTWLWVGISLVVSALLVGMGIAFWPENGDASCIAYWNLNAMTESKFADSVGPPFTSAHNRSQIAVGQPSVPAGRYGTLNVSSQHASDFGTCVRIPKGKTLWLGSAVNSGSQKKLRQVNVTGEFTLMAWLNPQDMEPTPHVLMATGASNQNGWRAGLHGRRLLFSAHARSGDHIFILPASEFHIGIAGGWLHLAVTVKGTSGERTVTFYVNGDPVGTGSVPDILPGSSKGMTLGGNAERDPAIAGGKNYGDSFDGFMDEIKVFNQVLTPSQIRHHALSTKISAVAKPVADAGE